MPANVSGSLNSEKQLINPPLEVARKQSCFSFSQGSAKERFSAKDGSALSMQSGWQMQSGYPADLSRTNLSETDLWWSGKISPA